MPKQRMQEPRDDFGGGLNTRQNADSLASNELAVATNARVSEVVGAFSKRTGTRRMHTTALTGSGAVTGLFQWDAPAGKQIVAICGGKLHHKTTNLGEFATITPTVAFSSSVRQTFATSRANVASAPLYLYIADGTYQRFTGAAVTSLVGAYTDGEEPPTTLYTIPALDLISNYHVRMFMRPTLSPQNILWSILGDPEDTTIGLYNSAGEAMVDVLRGEPITAMEVLGSSLLIATEDSVVRFTGYASDDIQISQDTEGISPDTGAVGRLALKRTESFAAMFSSKGLYAVTEESAIPISEKILPNLKALKRTSLSSSVVGYHKGRKEIWLAVEGPTDTGNKTVYILSIGATQAWSGPFTYPFAITCFASFEDTSGDEWLMAGCADGFVRLMDTGYKDDVLADASGGSYYTMTVELAPFFFDSGPTVDKTLERIFLQADMVIGETLTIDYGFDSTTYAGSVVATGIAGGLQDYRLDACAQGKRLRLRIRDVSTVGLSVIHGIVPTAFHMMRS